MVRHFWWAQLPPALTRVLTQYEQMLDTETGSPAEMIYPKLGYIQVRVQPIRRANSNPH
jgi:hypothetical protein